MRCCGFGDYTLLFFFFSSRRRHTRLVSDWSSDVCSSDLARINRPARLNRPASRLAALSARRLLSALPVSLKAATDVRVQTNPTSWWTASRSEERRVGKERRTRRERYH